jgi:hypothetical protein
LITIMDFARPVTTARDSIEAPDDRVRRPGRQPLDRDHDRLEHQEIRPHRPFVRSRGGRAGDQLAARIRRRWRTGARAQWPLMKWPSPPGGVRVGSARPVAGAVGKGQPRYALSTATSSAHCADFIRAGPGGASWQRQRRSGAWDGVTR